MDPRNRFVFGGIFALLAATLLMPSALFAEPDVGQVSAPFTVRELGAFCPNEPAHDPGVVTEVEPGTAYDMIVRGLETGWHNSCDQGTFVYVMHKGDFDISAQVPSFMSEVDMTNHGHARGGIMARKSLDSRDLIVAAHVLAENHNAAWLRPKVACNIGIRTRVGGNLPDGWIDHFQPVESSYPNIWIRMKREGNNYTGLMGTDGVNWQTIGTFQPPLGDEVYVGIYAHGGAPNDNRNIPASVQFRNIKGLPKPANTSLRGGTPMAGNIDSQKFVNAVAHKGRIEIDVPGSMKVDGISISDAAGNLIGRTSTASLRDTHNGLSRYTIKVSEALPQGACFVRIQSANATVCRKVILTR